QTGSDARFLLTKNQKRVTIHRRSNKSLDRSAFSGLLIDNLRLSTLRARPVNSNVKAGGRSWVKSRESRA
ncbi:MAG: hypothetical protein QOH71_970, partial [Blastocatellia bacterium]|nr:hypothetical protein [Blastocatellia bacterium]